MLLNKKITCLIFLFFALSACEKDSNVTNVQNIIESNQIESLKTTTNSSLSGLKYDINLPQYDLSCEPDIPLFLIVTDDTDNNVFLDLHLNSSYMGNNTVTSIHWTVGEQVKNENTNSPGLMISPTPNQEYNVTASIYHTDGQSIGLTEIKFCFYSNGQLGKVVTEKYSIETTILNQMPTTEELKKGKDSTSVPNSPLVVTCGEICWCWMDQSYTDNAKEEETEFKFMQGTFVIITP